jgi:transcriptional regulator with XRE-family HTH domain
VNTFGDRLNRLFERARERGRPLTNEDIERLTNGRISANHVWRLRHGRNHNPGLDTLQLLADVFGVALDYFGGYDDESDEGAIRRALAQPELREVVVRLGTVQVSPRDAARLARIVDVLLADADDPNVAALSNDLGQNHRTTESGEASYQARSADRPAAES